MNPILQELDRHQREVRAERETVLATNVHQILRYVPPLFEPRAAEHLRPFVAFCEGRGVSHLPARPDTVAAFLLAHLDLSPSIDRVLEILDGIEALHDAHSLASPVRSSIVAAALARYPGRDPPRSWPAADRILFLQLPLMVQHAIARREAQRDKAVRQAQSKLALIQKPPGERATAEPARQ